MASTYTMLRRSSGILAVHILSPSYIFVRDLTSSLKGERLGPRAWEQVQLTAANQGLAVLLHHWQLDNGQPSSHAFGSAC